MGRPAVGHSCTPVSNNSLGSGREAGLSVAFAGRMIAVALRARFGARSALNVSELRAGFRSFRGGWRLRTRP